MFSANAGIITNASARGVAWERPTSIEWITPDGVAEFQVDAGIRIQGAFFRSNSNNLKKSFRLLFKDIYGPGKLEFPLFEGAVDSFNTLVLRGGGNDGYTWNSAKLTEQYTRDQFMRESAVGVGQRRARTAISCTCTSTAFIGGCTTRSSGRTTSSRRAISAADPG